MQLLKIEELIGETTDYDKKQAVEVKRPKSWCKSIRAFANIFDNRLDIYSPGGMFDGIRVQDRNIRRIQSRRRTPVLEDIFDRLGYMERSGSGFEKILDGYEVAKNYSEKKEPEFYSDSTMFLVTLPNLNYPYIEPAKSAEKPLEKPANSLEPAKKPANYFEHLTPRKKEALQIMEYGIEYSAKKIAEKGNSLDLGLIRDDSLVDYEDLPDPIESAEDSIAKLSEAMDLLQSVVNDLKALEVQ